MSDSVGLAGHSKALVGEVTERACYCQAARHSAVHYFAAGSPYSVYFLWIGSLVILRKSLSGAVLAEDRPRVSSIGHIHHVVIALSPDDSHACSCATLVRVQHFQLLIKRAKHRLQRLIQICRPFRNFFGYQQREGFGAMLGHLLASMAVKHCKEAATGIAPDLVEVAVRVLHVWAVGTILVFGVGVLSDA